MSYRKLEIWDLARGLTVDIHKMTMEGLPRFESYEEGSQIRRSIKSVKSNIVEGYGDLPSPVISIFSLSNFHPARMTDGGQQSESFDS